MMIPIAVAVVTVGALVGWRWWLDLRRWQIERVATERDEAAAKLEPRLAAIEKLVQGAEWAKIGRR
jgi:hypothetical protein